MISVVNLGAKPRRYRKPRRYTKPKRYIKLRIFHKTSLIDSKNLGKSWRQSYDETVIRINNAPNYECQL